jgi:hypothetical protein
MISDLDQEPDPQLSRWSKRQELTGGRNRRVQKHANAMRFF